MRNETSGDFGDFLAMLLEVRTVYIANRCHPDRDTVNFDKLCYKSQIRILQKPKPDVVL